MLRGYLGHKKLTMGELKALYGQDLVLRGFDLKTLSSLRYLFIDEVRLISTIVPLFCKVIHMKTNRIFSPEINVLGNFEGNSNEFLEKKGFDMILRDIGIAAKEILVHDPLRHEDIKDFGIYRQILQGDFYDRISRQSRSKQRKAFIRC